MFIEQKHGWSDILSGMPVFGIRESKKRVVEYILGLDTFKNEKERDRLNGIKTDLENKWEQLIKEIQRRAYSESCDIVNIPVHPCVLSDKQFSRIAILTVEKTTIDEKNNQLKTEYDSLRQLKPRVTDNFEALNTELSETEAAILKFEEIVRHLMQKLSGISYESRLLTLRRLAQTLRSDLFTTTDTEASEAIILKKICNFYKYHL